LANTSEKESVEPNEEDFYGALGHKIRRVIIKYIGDHQIAGFSNLKKETQSSTGTIYHHLDVLKNLITQNSKKKYYLTSLGIHAYKFLNQNLDTIESVKVHEDIIDSPKDNPYRDNLTFKRLYQFIINNPKKGVFLSPTIILLISLFSALIEVQAYLFFFIPIEPTEELSGLNLKLLTFFSNIFGFLILFLTTELLCRFIFNKKENWQGLLNVLGIPYIPMLFYLAIIGVLMIIDIDNFMIIIRILLILFQVWSMILLSFSISLTKYIRFERGLILSIFIDYGTFMIMLMILNPIL
jgi:hypothetical protein